MINLGGSATTALGYNTAVKYVMPDFLVRDQSLQLAIGALQQSLQAYDQTARTAGVTLDRKLSNHWNATAGVSLSDERIGCSGGKRCAAERNHRGTGRNQVLHVDRFAAEREL
jgi:hypothetical protein